LKRSRKRTKKKKKKKKKRMLFGGMLGWGVTKPFVFLTPQLEAQSQEERRLGKKKKRKI